MFYCDVCAGNHRWPLTLFTSRGVCEVCGQVRPCNERPARDLPPLAKPAELAKLAPEPIRPVAGQDRQVTHLHDSPGAQPGAQR